jgi:hypothetical protein
MYSPHFGEILKDTAWLPDRDGNFHKPEEITLLELPEEFQSDEYIHGNFLKKITMPESEPEDSLNPREQQALEELAKGDPDRKKRIESFLSASDDAQEKFLKLIQDEDQPESAQSFKDGLKNLERSQKGAVIDEGRVELPPVSNPDRYQEKLNKQVEDGVEEQKSTPHKNKFSPVKEAPSNAEARSFLYEEYQGHCQITGTTFPKAAKNLEGLAENYFEACNLLSYRSADYLNDAGNMICVSADTMAKLKHASRVFLDDIEDVIKIFKENNGNMKNVSVKILLAGEECAITWSQRHFMRLVALYEMA